MKEPIALHDQQGVMLLEALIGILIFSIGILALLAMQTTAMRATVDAKYRSEAGFLANELVGAMWVDINNLNGYSTAACSGTPACATWLNRVQTILPQATGPQAPTIVVAGRAVTITLFWKRDNEPVNNHSVTVQINAFNGP